MNAKDILLATCLALLPLGLLRAGTTLRRRADWERRLTDAHATLFARVGEAVLQLARNAAPAVRGPRRAQHVGACLAALLFIAILVAPPVLAERLDLAEAGRDAGLALTLGTIVWSALTEMPGVVERRPHLSPTPEPLPTLVLVLVVLVLDVGVTMLALSGALEGAAASTFALGASFVAAADIVSAAVGLVAAACSR
jgi:hypothetical protein